MCGRFALNATPDVVEDIFGVAGLERFPPRFNIAPTQPILMVVAGPVREQGSNQPSRDGVLVRWGFVPSWVKEPASISLLINARAETVIEKPSFRTAMRHRRTLIPASGFYEWRRVSATEKQAYWIKPRGGGTVAFAGLMEMWADAAGNEIDTGAIITTQASADIAWVHNRMPVIIHSDDFEAWLDCRSREPRDVAQFMQPVEEGFFEAIPVSDKVNKVTNTSPDIQTRTEERVSASKSKKKKNNQLGWDF